MQERGIESQSPWLRKRKSLKCFSELFTAQKCSASRNCVQKKISIEKCANRQTSETAKRRKTKYFSESRAILAFPAFAKQRALPRQIRGEHPNNPLGVLYILWFGGKNELHFKVERAQQTAPAGQSKASWVLQKAQNPRPFCLPAELCR